MPAVEHLPDHAEEIGKIKRLRGARLPLFRVNSHLKSRRVRPRSVFGHFPVWSSKFVADQNRSSIRTLERFNGSLRVPQHSLALSHAPRVSCTNCCIMVAGIAPDFLPTILPPLNTINVGMPLIWNFSAISGTTSVSTFATSHWPRIVSATFANSGAIIRHGPHHCAQKSTTTGKADSAINRSKTGARSISTGSPGADKSTWHLPQRKVDPSRPYAIRFRVPHCGQGATSPSSSA